MFNLIKSRFEVLAAAHAYCTKAYPRAASGLEWHDFARQRIRWTFLALFSGPGLPVWFDLIQMPAMAPFLANNPRLAFKPMRVYMATNWPQERRLRTLIDTYTLVLGKGGAVRQALFTPEPDGVVLATLALGEEIGALEICLGLEACLRKEGELTLFIRQKGRQQHIMSLAFSLSKRADGTLAAYIGCIQGQNQHAEIAGLEIMRILTKAMHGLRPKAFMVFLAQETARALGATSIQGVGSCLQAHHRKHLIHLPFIHTYSFDYDGLWREEGGVKIETGPDRGWFELPAQLTQKTHADIKPQKRPMYKKRYAMLDALARDIQEALA